MQCPDCNLSLESRVVEYSPMGKSVLSVCPNCARVSIERQIFGPVTGAQSRVCPRQSEVGMAGVLPLDPIRLHVEPEQMKISYATSCPSQLR